MQRGWQILRRYKLLWLLGIIAVVAGQDALFHLRGALRLQPFMEAIVNLPLSAANVVRDFTASDTGTLSLLLLISVGVLLTFVGVFVNAAIIALTRAAERGAVIDFKTGWHAGLRRSWPLLIIRLIFNIPAVILSLIAFVIGLRVAAGASGYSQLLQALEAVGILPFLLIAGAVIGVILGAIGVGADRSCVLDDTGVIESLRQGWRLLRQNTAHYIYIAGSLLGTLAMLFFVITCPLSLILTDAVAGLLAQAPPNADFFAVLLGTPVGAIIVVVLVILYGGYSAFATVVWTLAYLRYA
jgi:hypothetical protein